MGGGRDRAIALAGAKIQRTPLAHPMNLRLYRGCCFSIEISTVGLVGLYRSGGKILLSQRERRRLEIFSRVKQGILGVAGAGRFLAQPPHFGTKKGSHAQPLAKACTVNAWSINGLPPRCGAWAASASGKSSVAAIAEAAHPAWPTVTAALVPVRYNEASPGVSRPGRCTSIVFIPQVGPAPQRVTAYASARWPFVHGL